MMELLWLLLPVAAATSWWAAKREYARQEKNQSRPNLVGADESGPSLKRLRHLLSDDLADKADEEIDVLLRTVEVNQDTAEAHLALGNMFRFRGEVDRAIRIHRRLIDGTSLTPHQRGRAMLDLGEDYLRAGLFDRAETLFGELAKESDFTDEALQHLVGIYEQEKDWRRAIAHNDRFQALTGRSKSVETAHYCCELAEEALQRDDSAAARECLRQALDRDPGSVRASMLRGRMAMNEGRYAAAISALQAVTQQDVGFFSEVIEPLSQCYEALGRRSDWMFYLRGVLQRDTHSGYVMVALVELLVRDEGSESAIRYIEAELQRYPTVLGLKWFIELKLAHAQGAIDPDLNALYRISRNLFDGSARYKCDGCGFVGKFLHWRCPSCKRWNKIRPLSDLMLKSNV